MRKYNVFAFRLNCFTTSFLIVLVLNVEKVNLLLSIQYLKNLTKQTNTFNKNVLFSLEKVDKKEKYYILLECMCNSVNGTIVLFEFHRYEIKK